MTFKSASLPQAMLQILLHKGTERPFTGYYTDWNQPGTYLCRLCGLALFRSQSKFHSGCGWPSFDEDIPNTVLRRLDSDGHRTEIICARCEGHLGHIFQGEQITIKNIRHCVNSLSLDFVTDLTVTDTEEAIFAAGCFWGVEYLFKNLSGVLRVEVGYTGGNKDNPSYEEVCRGDTGHVEAVRVIFDPAKLSFKKLAMYFFEIHNFSQIEGQGPDIGGQYRSVAFYYNDQQKKILEELIQELRHKSYSVVTAVQPVTVFWRAEEYHQHYYDKTGGQPYCHRHTSRF